MSSQLAFARSNKYSSQIKKKKILLEKDQSWLHHPNQNDVDDKSSVANHRNKQKQTKRKTLITNIFQDHCSMSLLLLSISHLIFMPTVYIGYCSN